MKKLIEASKYFSLIAVVTLLLVFVLALLWGVSKGVAAGAEIVTSRGQSSSVSLLLIKVIDAFLIAIVLYLLAASIYRLFIDDVALPARMVARNLPELKSKLSGIIVLVMAVHFVEDLFEETQNPMDILWRGLATSAVAGALIAFSHLGAKDEEKP